MTGQDAVHVAEEFAVAVDFDGVVLSKLDGDARGGAALSVRAVTGQAGPVRLDQRAPRRTSSASTPTAWHSGSSAWATC